MKTFDEIYDELQNENNNKLNDVWKEAEKGIKKTRKNARIICLIVDILFIIFSYKYIMNTKSLLFIVYIIGFFIIIDVIIFEVISSINKVSEKSQLFEKQYKNIVIKKIMSNFYDDLEYFQQKQMPEYIYKKTKYEYYSIYNSEDYLEAYIDNRYSTQMAEVLTEDKETYKDSNGETKERIVKIFHGLFAKIVMDNSINSELRVVQGGGIVQEDRLNMDSSEFEKYFDVQASNKIIGMQLLTSDVMEELIEFENKTNMKYDIYIKNNELYLRFHSGPMFEVENLEKGALDKDTIRKYFYMLNFTYNLSNRLINIVNDTLI